jgi:hypothetical protein
VDTRHPDDGTLLAFVEDQLPAGERERIATHVDWCAECAATVAEARGMIAAASRIVGALDDVPAGVLPARRVRRIPRWTAAAAVLVLSAGVSTVLVQQRATEKAAPTERAALAGQAAGAADADAGVPIREPESSQSGSAVSAAPASPAVPHPPAAAPTAARAAPAPSAPPAPVTITGRVVAEDGTPLPGANVFINEVNASVGTDSSGRYSITVPAERPRDSVIVRARAPGYAMQAETLHVGGGRQTVDLRLEQSRSFIAEASAGRALSAEQPGLFPPIRTVRYQVRPGVVVELREYPGGVGAASVREGALPSYMWHDPRARRTFVLSGPLPLAELELLAHRLGELVVVP